ncbi:hypothetical protein DFJ74DRAFT_742629 [Hyaloraphidium curvatum]|nr:hypothetical protein DFJ74DRAFT_742629 [Hyaloraphidium curvatum]
MFLRSPTPSHRSESPHSRPPTNTMEAPASPLLLDEILIIIMELLAGHRWRWTLLATGLACRRAWHFARPLLHDGTLEVTETNYLAVQRLLTSRAAGAPPFRELHLEGSSAHLIDFASPMLATVERVSMSHPNQTHYHHSLLGRLSHFPLVVVNEPAPYVVVQLVAECFPRELVLLSPKISVRRLAGMESSDDEDEDPEEEEAAIGRSFARSLLDSARNRPPHTKIVVRELRPVNSVGVRQQTAVWKSLRNTVVE